ncbi:hypothetical protein [Bradyrhizobium icense]|uniref:Uncharacterized protein n=1 Tax=Bradyrhizobium icense TaxID=1274631 RepID=A0A1B1UEI3_9BRAD|nr:hypothetical protein [Bradyrhizobium icense]ANW01096.1 hypothetical protein LMTR13_13840 [Bradyrhizobium icense]
MLLYAMKCKSASVADIRYPNGVSQLDSHFRTDQRLRREHSAFRHGLSKSDVHNARRDLERRLMVRSFGRNLWPVFRSFRQAPAEHTGGLDAVADKAKQNEWHERQWRALRRSGTNAA